MPFEPADVVKVQPYLDFDFLFWDHDLVRYISEGCTLYTDGSIDPYRHAQEVMQLWVKAPAIPEPKQHRPP